MKPEGPAIIEMVGENIDSPICSRILSAFRDAPRVSEHALTRVLCFDNDGVEITLNNSGLVGSVHLFSEGLDGKKAYIGTLPFSICFGDRCDEVRRKCGIKPTKTGAEGEIWRGRVLPAWEVYTLDAKEVHIQYSRVDGGVELVTLSLIPEQWFPTLMEAEE